MWGTQKRNLARCDSSQWLATLGKYFLFLKYLEISKYQRRKLRPTECWKGLCGMILGPLIRDASSGIQRSKS